MDDLSFVAVAARLAVLMAGGDATGIESLARASIRASGADGCELERRVEELMSLARGIAAAFDELQPGGLSALLAGVEGDLFADFTGQLDDDNG